MTDQFRTDRDAITTSITEPSTPRLRLQYGGRSSGLLDGGWWPRSASPVAELPGLIFALDHLRGPVIRIVVHRGDWTHHPRRLGIAGRVIPVAYFASHPSGLLSAYTRSETDSRIDLLIVPAQTKLDRADTAMLLAATRSNTIRAEHILDHLDRIAGTGDS